MQRMALVIGLSAVVALLAGDARSATGWSARERVVALEGGRRIAIRCAGRGSFTVLLETGDGGRRAHMAALFSALSRRYRVCAYDRRNVGRSSAAPIPRKAADLSADAFDALAAAGARGPYILFGTSMGGLLVRSYAATRDVAGFVTSNQPATAAEWERLAYPVRSPSERAADEAWMAGANNEHIDVKDVSRTIDTASPPSIPYVMLVSTERFQCKAADVCGPTYRAFVAASREAALAGPRGSLRMIDGDHDLYVTNLADVAAAIDQVAAAARGGPDAARHAPRPPRGPADSGTRSRS